ncbi:MAG: SufE family protein [Bacteroidia bacterium]
MMEENLSIQEIEQDIIDEFEMFDDWMDKYNYIIEMGNDLPELDEKYKIAENIVKGCQSQVWLHSSLNDGKVVYIADSDAIITKGLIALLIRVMSNKTPDEIVNAELQFIDAIGMKEHLSPNRANGLVAMVKKMKMYALAHKVQVS